MVFSLVILGLIGFLSGVVSIYVNTWAISQYTFARPPDSRGKRPGVARLVWASSAMVLLVYLPVAVVVVAVYALTGSPERTFLNGLALLLCGVRLCSLGAIWSRLIEYRACLKLFTGAAWLMALLGAGVVLLYGSLWSSAGQYTDGLGQMIAGAGIVLSAPVWIGLYVGVSSLPAMAASLIARTLPSRPYANSASTASPPVAESASYAFKPVSGVPNGSTDEVHPPP